MHAAWLAPGAQAALLRAGATRTAIKLHWPLAGSHGAERASVCLALSIQAPIVVIEIHICGAG